MTTQNQDPHFPCGPCPLSDEILPVIQHYTTLAQNLRLFLGSNTLIYERESMDHKIGLIDGFLAHLQRFYDLASESMEANKLEVVE